MNIGCERIHNTGPVETERKKSHCQYAKRQPMLEMGGHAGIKSCIQNPGRITKILKEQAEKYNWEETKLPTKVKDISKWGKANERVKRQCFRLRRGNRKNEHTEVR